MTIQEPEPLAVVLCSGGMDSTTLAYRLRNHGQDLKIAKELDATHEVISLSLGLSGSALTDPSIKIPHGYYTEPRMRATVVPNRNAFLSSLAFASAIARGAGVVGFAAHAGDYAIYPDCRPEFVDAFQEMQNLATDGFGAPRLTAPFLGSTKADIVKEGEELGVPWGLTWSCYEGEQAHCGRCGACTERREAFKIAGVPDPTEYAS